VPPVATGLQPVIRSHLAGAGSPRQERVHRAENPSKYEFADPQTELEMTEEELRHAKHPLKRYVLISVGTLFLIIGAIGIVVPVMPTTPFLLLAAACYIRSSKRFHDWLLNNRVLGRYIRDYLSGEGMPMAAKATTLVLLWTSIGVSIFIAVDAMWLRVLLLVIAAGVTAHILTICTRR
jgi:uncharacterized membrane protein YbaN (DUF454 family)